VFTLLTTLFLLQNPVGEPSPAERLRTQILSAFNNAKGVEVAGNAKLIDIKERLSGSSGVLAATLFDGHLGKDLQGRLRIYSLLATDRLPEIFFWEFHSNGLALTALNHIEESWQKANLRGALNAWKTLATRPGMPRLDFLFSWLNWQYTPPESIELLSKPRQGSGVKGITFTEAKSKTEWWIDTKKQFTKLVFLPNPAATPLISKWGDRTLALEIEFQTFRLLNRNPLAGKLTIPPYFTGAASAPNPEPEDDVPPPPGRNT